MPSNYPPGVTGSEYPIAGPDYEREAGRCPSCGEDTLYEYGYQSDSWLDCTECDFHEELDRYDRYDEELDKYERNDGGVS